MGSDDLFKARRSGRKKRKHEYREPKANSYLIVTEGKKTEPLYFKGIQRQIEKTVGGRIDIVEAPIINIYGQGSSTGRLIEAAEKIVKDAKILYQNIWIVFDKDDFLDFDKAIKEGKDKGYNIAWSNQSFEYCIYLHFAYSDAAMHRDEWNKKLNEIFKRHGLGDGEYKKNYDNIYELINKAGSTDTAIKNAKRRMSMYRESIDKPSTFNPGTTVHELVEELMGYINEED